MIAKAVPVNTEFNQYWQVVRRDNGCERVITRRNTYPEAQRIADNINRKHSKDASRQKLSAGRCAECGAPRVFAAGVWRCIRCDRAAIIAACHRLQRESRKVKR